MSSLPPTIWLLDIDAPSSQALEVAASASELAHVVAISPAELVGFDGDHPTAALIACGHDAHDRLSRLVDGLRARLGTLPILAVVDAGDPEAMTSYLETGIDDFVTCPIRTAELRSRIARFDQHRSDTDPVVQRLKQKLGLARFIGECDCFLEAIRTIPLVAKSDSTVLIRGETGTGKDLVARAVHHLSPRSGGPFIPVNVAAIPDELVENELFGHDRAAFTGADRERDGLVAAADGGTLFLDEIDSLKPSVQAKLLRLLQDGEYRPLGSTHPRSADIRFLAATNSDLSAKVETGGFRRDLFYRIDVLRIDLPALRERGRDVLLLSRHLLQRHADRLGRSSPTLSPDAAIALSTHDWPGNVRELEHALERALVLLDGRSAIRAADLGLPCTAEEAPVSFREAKARVVSRFETQYVEGLLRVYSGNVSRAAAAAGQNRRAFFEVMRRRNIDPNRFRPTAD